MCFTKKKGEKTLGLDLEIFLKPGFRPRFKTRVPNLGHNRVPAQVYNLGSDPGPEPRQTPYRCGWQAGLYCPYYASKPKLFEEEGRYYVALSVPLLDGFGYYKIK